MAGVVHARLQPRACDGGRGDRRGGGLTEAIALYRASGYVEVPPFNDEPYAHHWFEKVLG